MGSTLPLMIITVELLEWNSSDSGCSKPMLTAVGIRRADHATLSIRKFGTNFADNRRSLGRYRLRTKAAAHYNYPTNMRFVCNK
jgi:hypothetical protein